MEILSTKPPELNSNDVAGSFQRITDYLYKTMEDIDFTLSKNRKEIVQSDSSATGLQEQIDGVRGDMVLLSNAFISLQNRVNTLTQRVDGIDEAITTINGEITDLDGRVSALENPTP